MDSFRKRFAEAKQADDARNILIEDLLQKVDDMQKTMERNAFVMVLIDGDNMNFLNDLVKQGIQGGDEAAKRLRRSVFDHLRYDEDFKHDQKIVIRVYANIRGLCKTYAVKGVLSSAAAFSDFVLGFNKAHPLCDFVDAGNQKEAADTKLKELLSLHVYNVHCKHILFGASADNAYASFLSSLSTDTDMSSKIRILKGPPFSFEFKQIIGKFRWTEFKDVFRSEFISNESSPYQSSHRTTEEMGHEPAGPHKPWPWLPKKTAGSYTNTNTPTDANVNTPMFEEAWNPYDSALQIQNRAPDHSHGFPQQQQQQQPNEIEIVNQSSAPSEPSHISQTPSEDERPPQTTTIEDALIRTAWERLQQSPRFLNFGHVRKDVTQELGLPSDFWDDEEWSTRSKNIMKMTVEEWVERTNNPPPGNATWMLRFFPPGQSPSAVMQHPSSESWRMRNP